ncbi:MAG: hypothetical protein KAH21_11510, partial [Spirochaetaceae bacterium]|nr:hypothetical protein [Spirochaetaceae bacterium]
KRLEVNGFEVTFLMGDLPQSKRLRIVDEVKAGKHKFLVATDVAARGLHINDLQMVINYDVPLEAESYVHRIGRTARAGQEGKTVTMACEEFVYGLGPIEKLLGQKIPVSWADESFMVEDKSAGMRFPPQDRYREIGGGRDDRNPRNDRRPRNSRPRNDSPRNDRPRNDNPRNDRPRNDKSRDPKPQSNKPANAPGPREPRNGTKALDPRTAKVQSAVSSVAGGSMDDVSTKNEVRNSKKRNPKPVKIENKQHTNSIKKKSSQNRKASKPNISEMERVNSENSVEERLEYYRKKYGEDFQFGGSSTGSAGSRKKKKSRSTPRGGEKQRSNQNSVNKPQTDKPAVNKQQVKEKDDKNKKKGLMSRLFGK